MRTKVLIIFGIVLGSFIFFSPEFVSGHHHPSDMKTALEYCLKSGDVFLHGTVMQNSTHYFDDTISCFIFDNRMIKGSNDVSAEERVYENFPDFLKPPLKQITSGIKFHNVVCNDSLERVYKKSDNTSACVGLDTKIELVVRGWATDDRLLLGCTSTIYEKCYPSDPLEYRKTLYDYYFDDSNTSSPKSSTVIPESSPESKSSDGVFYPRYQVSVFQNTKTMEPYVTPDFITIGPNSQVTWHNLDRASVSLNSVDPDNMWATSIIPPNGHDTVTFEEPGIYEYKGNAGIHGFVVVMDDDGQLLESKFSDVFGNGSPLMYADGLEPVLLYDNCKRYVYWLNEHGHKEIHVPEDYPRYPPWGNQIFPLVEFCTSNGYLIQTAKDDSIRWEFKIENSLRSEDRLQVGNTAGYTTVYVTLSSWDEYEHWESKRGDEHDKMPPLVITQDNINPIVFDLLQEMWKFEDYEVSNHDPHLFKKKIQKDYSVPNHHAIHDWMESEYAKQFGQSNDGFSHYFEFQDNVYTITMLAVD